MRQLTYEQQAAVPDNARIGTLEAQGLPADSNGVTFVRGTIAQFIEHGVVATWRHAVALGIVSRSRYGEWTPFRTKTGGETSHPCDEGIAWANDGVHTLIRQIDGKWISRSNQVVTIRVKTETPDSGKFKRVTVAQHLQPEAQPRRSLADEYASL